MKEVNSEELKRLQMDVLDAIHNFCIDNNLRYSLACGTLLGAARHKGYIPWDDDIDIYMYRDDYNRLVKSFPELYKNRYKIASLERDKDWDRPYAKAFDNRTVFWEPGTTSPLGINIDIFPIDDVPDDDKLWHSFNCKRRALVYLIQLKSMELTRKRSLYKNLFIVLIRAFTCLFSRRLIAKFIDNYIKQFNGLGYSRCFESSCGLYQKSPFLKSYFDHLINLQFEDRKYCAFKDYDSCLTSGFGNWRQLPPVEKRISHHLFRAYLKF